MISGPSRSPGPPSGTSLAAGLLRGRRDPRVDGRDDLGAVGPVHLEAVVFPRVVAGRDHQAGRGLQVADGEGQHGRRDRAARRQHAQPSAGQHRGGFGRERLGATTGVVADDDRAGGGVRDRGLQVPRQAGRDPAHGGPVHPGRAGSQRPADTRGAERQRLREPRRQFVVVPGLQERAQLGPVRRVGIIRNPRPRRLPQPVSLVARQRVSPAARRTTRAWPAAAAPRPSSAPRKGPVPPRTPPPSCRSSHRCTSRRRHGGRGRPAQFRLVRLADQPVVPRSARPRPCRAGHHRRPRPAFRAEIPLNDTFRPLV